MVGKVNRRMGIGKTSDSIEGFFQQMDLTRILREIVIEALASRSVDLFTGSLMCTV